MIGRLIDNVKKNVAVVAQMLKRFEVKEPKQSENVYRNSEQFIKLKNFNNVEICIDLRPPYDTSLVANTG